MKRTTIVILASFLFFTLVGFLSCRKNPQQTPTTRMVGKWKQTQYATDDNNDGTIESSEVHNVSSTLDNEMTFNNELTGVQTTVSNGVASTPLDFSWRIVGGDSVWVAYKANDTATFYIAELSTHDLQLTENTSQGLVSFYYVK